MINNSNRKQIFKRLKKNFIFTLFTHDKFNFLSLVVQKQSAGSLQQLQQGQQQQQQPQGQQQQQNVNQLAAAAVASGFPYNQQFAAQMNAAPYLASLYPMFRPEDYGLLQQQMMPVHPKILIAVSFFLDRIF